MILTRIFNEAIMKNPAGNQSLLLDLEGCSLDGLTFIQDYLQMLFCEVNPSKEQADSFTLNLLTWPKLISVDSQVYDQYSFGYRDRLCSLIGDVVRSVTMTDQEVRLEFTSGNSLAVSLNEADREGAEVIILHNDTSRECEVWN